jgi:hypothetical protein
VVKVIEATEYTRQDGLKAIKLSSGKWVVRKINGTAWFYMESTNMWILLNQDHPNLEDVGMVFDRAMELLSSLPELT